MRSKRSPRFSVRAARALCCWARGSRPRTSTAWSTTVILTWHGEAMKRRVAILISGRGSNMAALIEAAGEQDVPAEIVAVISNRADALGLEKAKASGVPTLTIESKPFGKDRAAFEVVLQAALEQHRIELICLGGFMRLLSAEFVERWYGRKVHIHPPRLRSLPGL